jgi:hypothetical protein
MRPDALTNRAHYLVAQLTLVAVLAQPDLHSRRHIAADGLAVHTG